MAEWHCCYLATCPSRKWRGGTLVLWRSRVWHFSGLIHNTSWPSPPAHTQRWGPVQRQCEARRWQSPHCPHRAAGSVEFTRLRCDPCQWRPSTCRVVIRSRKLKKNNSPLLCSTLMSSPTTTPQTIVAVKVVNTVIRSTLSGKWGWTGSSMGAVTRCLHFEHSSSPLHSFASSATICS